jgi:hypothetical protein
MSIIPALGRQRQEDLEFKASVRNIGRACFKTKQKSKKQQQKEKMVNKLWYIPTTQYYST